MFCLVLSVNKMLKFHGLNESESGEETKDEEAVLTIEAKVKKTHLVYLIPKVLRA